MSAVQVGVEAGVATITLNAPERLNAVDTAMLDALTAALRDADARDDVRVVALTGAGRGFCAGANLAPSGDEPMDATLVSAGAAIRTLMGSRTPVVALVNGVAAGVGVSLALACPYVLATASASFMLAFTKIGLMPDGGATALVAASIGRARALRMAMTAEKVPAATAVEWGLIAESVPDAEFAARSAALVAGFAAGATRSLAQTVAAVNAATLDVDSALDREERGQRDLFTSSDFDEGVAAFLAKRPPVFTGR